MSEKAFSSDGYIINQDFTSEYQYGAYPSSDNGCGWIAVFNLMRALGRDVGHEQVYEEMKAILPYEGRQGTPVETMECYLDQKGVAYDYMEGKDAVLQEIPKYTYGIFRYAEQGIPHYVTFLRVDGEQFRFFNADTTKESHICSMRQFFQEHAVEPVIKALVVK